MDITDCKDFNYEDLVKERGTKKFGYVNIAKKVDGSDVRIPYMVVTGAEEGLTILVEACCHGDEQEGTEGLIKLYKELDPMKLKGTLVGIPALNLESFNAGDRSAPQDWSHQDMNRCFPGDPSSFITKKVAHYYWENFVKNADLSISFHGGGNHLWIEPLSLYPCGSDPKLNDMVRRMAYATGTKLIWIETMESTKGCGFQESNAYADGVASITVELGGQCIRHEHRDEMVAMAADTIRNVMMEFDMLEGNVPYIDEHIEIETLYLHTLDGGFHKVKVKPMEFVKEGTVLSEIEDLFGNKVSEMIAPFDCYICSYWCYPVIQPGNWGFILGKPLHPETIR
ncbi:succinylglutamate desuccinylase/aspartoacylase family protein [Clostridium transplantifaecale]|uniref:succinylglutamate desuccinylase/aspartoacylase family protein n=1 Tax=Clostridium transplantifaecale TaxID=2479838 RepID=UPI0013DDDCDC|nr:M14 family metallopeptidase [Clostridium transplantifaecale]